MAGDHYKSAAVQHSAETPVERFDLKRLLTVVPGSSRRNWLCWIPFLIEQRALVKRGKGWLGRRHQIEAALLGQLDASPASVTSRRVRKS